MPDRVRRLAVLSVGHPADYWIEGVPQRARSWYMWFVRHEGFADEAFRKDDWRLFREWAAGAPDLERYLEDLSRPGRLKAALDWYRGRQSPEFLVDGAVGLPGVTCPTWPCGVPTTRTAGRRKCGPPPTGSPTSGTTGASNPPATGSRWTPLAGSTSCCSSSSRAGGPEPRGPERQPPPEPGGRDRRMRPNGEQGVTIPGWTITEGMPNIVCYGAPGGFPTQSTPGPSNRGNTFFTRGAPATAHPAEAFRSCAGATGSAHP